VSFATDPPLEEQRHALYRFYTDQGQLLYVGITNDPARRIDQHGERKAWWQQVAGMTIEWYPTRSAVLAAERRAVQVENPKHNVQLRTRQTIKDRGPRTKPAIELVWNCAVCRAPIANGQGYLHVSYRTIYEVEQAAAAWKQKYESADDLSSALIPLSAYDEFPSRAGWFAHHRTCDPSPDGNDYWFDVARARTHAHLLDWTAHLMGKVWLEHTNWQQLIQSRAGVDA